MAISINAVATIWATAPIVVHATNRGVTGGSGFSVATAITTRKRIPNGRPNRNRMKVAPAVPIVSVSSRCIALRAT
jgi:hypothetical protein